MHLPAVADRAYQEAFGPADRRGAVEARVRRWPMRTPTPTG